MLGSRIDLLIAAPVHVDLRPSRVELVLRNSHLVPVVSRQRPDAHILPSLLFIRELVSGRSDLAILRSGIGVVRFVGLFLRVTSGFRRPLHYYIFDVTFLGVIDTFLLDVDTIQLVLLLVILEDVEVIVFFATVCSAAGVVLGFLSISDYILIRLLTYQTVGSRLPF